MVAEEKDVDYELIPTMPHADNIKAINPTGKVPRMPDGAFELSESQVIALHRYKFRQSSVDLGKCRQSSQSRTVGLYCCTRNRSIFDS